MSKEKSLLEIKYWLDLMLIPIWKEKPIGYECNQQTWDNMPNFLPKRKMKYELSSSFFTPTFIVVREGVPDGFHPVYDLNYEHIPQPVKLSLLQNKKKWEEKKNGN